MNERGARTPITVGVTFTKATIANPERSDLAPRELLPMRLLLVRAS